MFDPLKPFAVDTRWSVEPANTTHLIVTVLNSGESDIFTSFEDVDRNGVWHHRNGSAQSHAKLADAMVHAATMYTAETEKQNSPASNNDRYSKMKKTKEKK